MAIKPKKINIPVEPNKRADFKTLALTALFAAGVCPGDGGALLPIDLSCKRISVFLTCAIVSHKLYVTKTEKLYSGWRDLKNNFCNNSRNGIKRLTFISYSMFEYTHIKLLFFEGTVME